MTREARTDPLAFLRSLIFRIWVKNFDPVLVEAPTLSQGAAFNFRTPGWELSEARVAVALIPEPFALGARVQLFAV